MTFTNEMKEKAKKAASAEELLTIAKEEGVELSASDAEMYYNFLNGSREMTDEELSQIAGGKGNDPKPNPAPKYKINQTVEIDFPSTSNILKGTITGIQYYLSGSGWLYRIQFTQIISYLRYHEGIEACNINYLDSLEVNPNAKVY